MPTKRGLPANLSIVVVAAWLTACAASGSERFDIGPEPEMADARPAPTADESVVSVPTSSAAPVRRSPEAKSRTHALGQGGRAAINGGNAKRVTMLWEVKLGGWGHAVAVSSKLGLAVADMSIHELASGKLVGRPTASNCGGSIDHGLAFADGKLIVVCAKGMELFDPRQLTRVREVPVHSATVHAVAFAWPRVALAHDDGIIRIHQLDGKPMLEVPVPGPPIEVKSLSMSKDGKRIAVGWTQGSIWWWDVAKPKVPHKLKRYSTQVNTSRFAPSGKLLAEEGPSFGVSVWDLSAGAAREKARVDVGRQSWINGLRFTKDERWVIGGGSSGLHISELSTGNSHEISGDGSIEDLAIDERGAYLVTTDRDGTLRAWGVK